MLTPLLSRAAQLISLLTLRPFDTDTQQGRSQERHRRALLTALAAAAAKIVTILTSLVSIPLTLTYLGNERFGLWMTISSVIALLSFADMGVGNGLLNAISDADGKDDVTSVRRYISSAFIILSVIAIIILIISFIVYPFISWAQFFNVKTVQAGQEAGPALAVFMVCFALNIPLGIVQRVQLGLQQGFLSNLWQAAGSIIGLLAILVAVHFHAGLPWLVLAMAGAPLLVSLLNGGVFFGYTRPDLRPKLALASRAAAKKVAHVGLLFLVLQIAVAITSSSDNIIITRILGPVEVAPYAVTAKMFSFITIVILMLAGPLWPAYSEAAARGDTAWIRNTLSRSIKATLLFATISSFFLFWAGPTLLEWWVGPQIKPPTMLFMGLAIWTVMEATGVALAMFLNGLNIVRTQVIIAMVYAISCITMKIIFIEHFGISGIAWGAVITYGPIVLIAYTLTIQNIFRTRLH